MDALGKVVVAQDSQNYGARQLWFPLAGTAGVSKRKKRQNCTGDYATTAYLSWIDMDLEDFHTDVSHVQVCCGSVGTSEVKLSA